jgi:hypothetical protein
MADETLRPILIVACFAAFFGVLMVAAGPLMAQPQEYAPTDLQGFSASYLATNRVWVDDNNEANYSIAVSSDMIGDKFTPFTEKKHIFFGETIVKAISTNAEAMVFQNNDSGETITTYIIMGQEETDPEGDPWERYENYVAVVRDYFVYLSHRYAVDVRSLEGVMSSPASSSTSLEIEVNTNYISSLHLVADTGYTLKEALNSQGNFSVMMSDSIMDDLTATNAWNSISKLLTFQFTGNTLFDYVIGFPLWVAIVYVSMRIIMAFIPFISGL